MKLCSSSPCYKSIINIILEDDIKKFTLSMIKNFTGQIDKKPFLNFCLESEAIKIIKKIVKNQQLNKDIFINKQTIELLLKNKKLSLSEKTYIYTKIIKKKLIVNDGWLLKAIIKYDIRALIWLEKSQKLTYSDYKLLFLVEINLPSLDFCRKKNIDFIKIIIKNNKLQPFNIEHYTNLLTPEELYTLIQKSLSSINNKEVDVNLLDSIIKILIDYQYLIEKIDISLLKKIHLENEQFFNFLTMDIEKVLLYKKFSQKKFKEKVNKI